MARSFKGAVILGLLCSGCAILKPEPPEEVVARRATERWQALIRGDFERAYRYYTPSFRKEVDLKSFALEKRKGVGVWQAARVEQVECPERERCRVLVRVKTRFVHPRYGPIESETPVEERWVYKDGKWWYVPE